MIEWVSVIPCIVGAQGYGDGVGDHPLLAVVADPCVFPRDPEQQVWKRTQHTLLPGAYKIDSLLSSGAQLAQAVACSIPQKYCE